MAKPSPSQPLQNGELLAEFLLLRCGSHRLRPEFSHLLYLHSAFLPSKLS